MAGRAAEARLRARRGVSAANGRGLAAEHRASGHRSRVPIAYIQAILLTDSAGSFDIAAAAGWYSAVAGLLAGFALLAILLPLDHEADDSEAVYGANAVVIYVCSFFALLILSVSYAVLSGRTGSGTVAGVAAHEQMLLGAAFGLATLLLLFGLHAILRTYGANRDVFAPADDLVMTVTSVLAPVLVLALQFSNTLDLQRYRAGESTDGTPTGVWLNLLLVAIGVITILVVAASRSRLPAISTAPRVVSKAVLGYTLAATIWASIAVPLLPVEVITGAWMEHGLMGLTVLGAVAVSIASWIGR